MIRSFLLGLPLALTVLADSWIFEAAGPSTPEIVRPVRESDDLPVALPDAPLPSTPSADAIRRPHDGTPVTLEPVSPSGWLGRRHWRSPT